MTGLNDVSGSCVHTDNSTIGLREPLGIFIDSQIDFV